MTNDRSEAGCSLQRTASERIRVTAMAGKTSHSGVRMTSGRAETAWTNAANATRTMQSNTSDFRLRIRAMVFEGTISWPNTNVNRRSGSSRLRWRATDLRERERDLR